MKSLISGIFGSAPVAYTSSAVSNLPFFGTRTDSEAQLRAMGSVGTLFAIVNRTSNATSQVNWRLYRSSVSGKKEDREEVTRHLALEVWNKPNPFMTRQEFVEAFQQHLDLTGEGWWLIGRDDRATFPMELWPMRPDKMEPVPSVKDFISGYIYNGPDGVKMPLGTNEVIFLRVPNPLDPFRGLGPVQSVLVNIDSARYSAEWNRNFFLNSAEPGGLLKMDRRLSDEEFNMLRERWNEQHRGVANAHRVAIIEEGEWVDRKYTNRDMQFVELSVLSDEKIRQAFTFPKPMLGTVDDANRANMEAAEEIFARYLLVPRLERIKGALNNDFLPLFGSTGKGVEFDYDDPIPENRELATKELSAKASAAESLRRGGWHPDDITLAVGLPDMRWKGDSDTQDGTPVSELASRS